MTHSRGLTVGIAALASSALLLTGCGQEASPAGNETSVGGDDLTEVSLIAVPVIDLAAIELGIDEGYFEEQGLQLTVDYAAGPALVPGVVSGQNDFGFTSTPSILQARHKGLALQAISESVRTTGDPENDHGGIFVAPDSGIDTAAGLEGKTVAVNQLLNLHQILTEISVEKAGGDPSKVDFLEIAFADMPAALENGEVDAVATSEPFTTITALAGNKRIASQFVDADPDFVAGMYFANEEYIAANEDVAKQFKAAVDKSNDFANENPDRVREAVAEITDIEPDVVESLILPRFESDFPSEPIQKFADLMLDAGAVDSAIDVEGLMGFVESQR